jgi:molybdopterin/thiamine biosynthesis adenylyltransferase
VAGQTQLIRIAQNDTIVRFSKPEFRELASLVFRRYPKHEWATFARFGWRDTRRGLAVSFVSLDSPNSGDMSELVGHVQINEPYTLRIALSAEHHPLAVGVIHSHPEDCVPTPSSIDDDMDGYYASYFSDFASGRPYISLIFSRLDETMILSGRIYWRGVWHGVEKFIVEGTPVSTWRGIGTQLETPDAPERTARLSSAFGPEAASRLRRSTVAVIGAGGTGSVVTEVLARAGVGKLIVVDPDHIEESNLERVHGSQPIHARQAVPKVEVARDHVLAIDPSCKVEGIIGRLPQAEVVDAVIRADVAVGCTDQQYSRLALSDIAVRFLVPTIDCGVALEGSEGSVTAQIIQIIRFLSTDPCALCRGMIVPSTISQELMSEEERELRREEAERALVQGENPNQYWRREPQLNTVGFLTTMAGSMAAGYAIGWLTGRFIPPFSRLQMNLLAKDLDVTDSAEIPRAECACRRIRGWSDQARADAFLTVPPHWPTARWLDNTDQRS